MDSKCPPCSANASSAVPSVNLQSINSSRVERDRETDRGGMRGVCVYGCMSVYVWVCVCLCVSVCIWVYPLCTSWQMFSRHFRLASQANGLITVPPEVVVICPIWEELVLAESMPNAFIVIMLACCCNIWPKIWHILWLTVGLSLLSLCPRKFA